MPASTDDPDRAVREFLAELDALIPSRAFARWLSELPLAELDFRMHGCLPDAWRPLFHNPKEGDHDARTVRVAEADSD